jgi:hypothetical protein
MSQGRLLSSLQAMLVSAFSTTVLSAGALSSEPVKSSTVTVLTDQQLDRVAAGAATLVGGAPPDLILLPGAAARERLGTPSPIAVVPGMGPVYGRVEIMFP